MNSTSDLVSETRPVGRWPAPASSDPATPAEGGLADRQQRIALYSAIMGACALGFFAIEKAAGAAHGGHSLLPLVSSELSQLFGCAVLLVGWQVARRARRMSDAALSGLDAAIVVIVSVAWAGMALFAKSPHAAHDAMLATVFTVLARAIIVPSAPSQTLWISAGASAAMPAIAWWVALASRERLGMGAPVASPAELTLQITLWAVLTTVSATIASKVIYGLRRLVREVRRLGQYTLEHKVGQGGMGVVYRARHALLRRPTAIKLIDQSRASEIQLRRFEREVQLTSQLSHPNTITVYDYGRTPEGVFYYAMEYLDGLNLEQLVRRHGPLPPARAIHLVRQACAALAEAHGVGLTHRDVKPANMIACERGGQHDTVKVLDFGLVRRVEHDREGCSALGVITGTPHYIPPEAIATPDRVDARSDLYGVGCVLYFLLTGAEVFAGNNIVQICGQHLDAPPVPPSLRSCFPISPELETVVLRCLAKDPAERPQSAQALEEELARCGEAEGWSPEDAELWWAAAPAEGAAQAAGQALADTVATCGERPTVASGSARPAPSSGAPPRGDTGALSVLRATGRLMVTKLGAGAPDAPLACS